MRARCARFSWRSRIDQRDFTACVQSFDGSPALALVLNLDLARLKSASTLNVDNALAIFQEQRLPGNVERILLFLPTNHDLSGKTGTQARIGVWKLNDNVELASHICFPELLHGHASHGLDGPAENLPGQSIELNFRRLSGLDIAAVVFVDFADDLHLMRVDHFRNGTARLSLVPFAVVGQSHAVKKESAGRVTILLNGDKPIDGGRNVHPVDVLLRLVHR